MRKILSKSTLLAVMMVGFVSLFAVGCGNSDNFVATGTTNTVNTGSLLFNINEAAAQQTEQVPNGTVSLRFDFWNSTTPTAANLVFTESRAFTGPNQTYQFDNVPSEVVFVTVTAFGANGQPLAILSGLAVVVPGATNTVDLTATTNPTFDALTLTPAPAIILTPGSPTAQTTVTGTFTANVLAQGTTTVNVDLTGATGLSSTFTEFPSNGSATANITTDGLVGLVSNLQNSTLTCEYTAFGTTRSASSLVRTCDFAGSFASSFQLPLNNGGGDFYNGGYNAFFYDSDGGATFFNVAANSTYALQTAATGITVNSATGRIDVASGAQTGTHFIVVTWTDPRTQNADGTGGTAATFTFTLPFTVLSL